MSFCRDRTLAQSCSRVAVKILRRSLTTLPSWTRQSMASQSRVSSSGPFTRRSTSPTAGVEKLYPVIVSNLPFGSSASRPRRSQAHLPTSAPFRARPSGPASGRFPLQPRLEERSLGCGFPSPFGVPASASWASCPAEGFSPSYDRPTGPARPGPRRGFHVPRRRDAAGVGAPYTPRPAVFTRSALGLRSPLAASPSGQALPPGSSSRRSRLTITRHHRGFTHVRPSGLPLARSFPRTERRPLGFFLELRTPSGRDPRAHVEAGTDLEH